MAVLGSIRSEPKSRQRADHEVYDTKPAAGICDRFICNDDGGAAANLEAPSRTLTAAGRARLGQLLLVGFVRVRVLSIQPQLSGNTWT